VETCWAVCHWLVPGPAASAAARVPDTGSNPRSCHAHRLPD